MTEQGFRKYLSQLGVKIYRSKKTMVDILNNQLSLDFEDTGYLEYFNISDQMSLMESAQGFTKHFLNCIGEETLSKAEFAFAKADTEKNLNEQDKKLCIKKQ